MLYSLVVACVILGSGNHGNVCIAGTKATGLTETQCTLQSIQLQIKAMDKGQSVYCYPEK